MVDKPRIGIRMDSYYIIGKNNIGLIFRVGHNFCHLSVTFHHFCPIWYNFNNVSLPCHHQTYCNDFVSNSFYFQIVPMLYLSTIYSNSHFYQSFVLWIEKKQKYRYITVRLYLIVTMWRSAFVSMLSLIPGRKIDSLHTYLVVRN